MMRELQEYSAQKVHYKKASKLACEIYFANSLSHTEIPRNFLFDKKLAQRPTLQEFASKFLLIYMKKQLERFGYTYDI